LLFLHRFGYFSVTVPVFVVLVRDIETVNEFFSCRVVLNPVTNRKTFKRAVFVGVHSQRSAQIVQLKSTDIYDFIKVQVSKRLVFTKSFEEVFGEIS